jgi:ATP-dependent DNA helicase DinG
MTRQKEFFVHIDGQRISVTEEVYLAYYRSKRRDRYLRSHYENERDIKMKAILKDLLKPVATIDLAEVTGLTPQVKRQINVPSRCSQHCPNRDSCRYLRFVRESMNPAIDIQVMSHNYLIADALHRSSGKRPLLPNYQTVIIDEAHKLLPAARSMDGTELSSDAAPFILEYLDTIRFSIKTAGQDLHVTAKKLLRREQAAVQGLCRGLGKRR